jgi:transcriptional regulator with XRE-family HTH domain
MGVFHGDETENGKQAGSRSPESARAAACGIIRRKQMSLAQSETPEHVRSTLGAILRRRREANERGLADVARPAGISTAFLSEVERGLKDISTERLLRLASALETTVGEIYAELGRELGAGEPLNAVGWEMNPRVQLRRMSEALGPDALQAAARFTTFLAMTEAAPKKRPIGFLR